MYIYIILLFLFLLLWHFEKNENSLRIVTLAFFCVLIIFCFRDYSVGVDTIGYIEEYKLGTSFDRSIDKGFAYYNQFLFFLGVPARLFLVLTSFLICFPVYFYIKGMAYKKMFAYILYVLIGTFSMHLSGMRQSMAMGFSLLGLYLAMHFHKPVYRFGILVISVLLASSFHNSANICFLYIPLIWLANKKMKLSKAFLLSSFLIPLIFPLTQIPQYLVNEFMVEKYDNYEIGSQNINIIAFFVIPYVIFAYTTFLMLKTKGINSNDKIGYFCSLMFAVSAASSLYMPMLARIGYYFSLPTLVLVANLTSRQPTVVRKNFSFLIIFIGLIFFFVSIDGGIMKIDNYKFSLE